MGTLRYGSPERTFRFDDRTLAHLAVAMVDELRGGESFWFSFDSDEGPTILLISRNVPLRYDFDNSARISINGDWVVSLEHAAHDIHGLRLVAEPAAAPLTVEAPKRELAGASRA